MSIRFGCDDVEVGLVGPGGLINFGAVLGTNELMHSVVAMTACETRAVSAAVLGEACAKNPELKRRLARYLQSRMHQTMTLAACHVRHSLEQRLASWIAAATRLTGAPDIQVTHQQLAVTLGVRRPSVSLALQLLEGREAIRSRRHCVIVRDREELENAACGCLREMLPRFEEADWNPAAAELSAT